MAGNTRKTDIETALGRRSQPVLVWVKVGFTSGTPAVLDGTYGTDTAKFSAISRVSAGLFTVTLFPNFAPRARMVPLGQISMSDSNNTVTTTAAYHAVWGSLSPVGVSGSFKTFKVDGTPALTDPADTVTVQFAFLCYSF